MFIIRQLRKIADEKKSAIAIRMQHADMTYEEFLQRVDGLSTTLRNHNIQPGDRVAIALSRSFEMIIAMFGVLACGATYVPLDPANPRARLSTILSDARPSILLSDDIEHDDIEHDDIEPIDELLRMKKLRPNDWLTSGIAFDVKSPVSAYIIYTSGSTGKPKGVEIGHQSLENYLTWALKELPFTGGGVPVFLPISFDHVVTAIFPPLLSGDTLVLLPSIEGGRTLASGLLDGYMNGEGRYSYVKITPSLFKFLDIAQRAQLGAHTNLLMFGGEKLEASLISDARRLNPELPILNHYGPTEATVGCCVYSVPLHFSAQTVPIGKPIPNVSLSVRHADGSIVEPTQTGELFITGRALAIGYWQRPHLTNRSFVTLMDDSLHESRWYRTGDLARYTSEGFIECLGRADDQIKILGHRIEPAEITAIINTYPNIINSLVFVHEHGIAHELVAVLESSSDKPETENIRQYLRNFLPSVMIPKHYLVVDKIPVAPSGKADLKKLQALLPEANSVSSIEEAVSNKFKEILNLDTIGWNDDYFLSGGDSLGTVEIATWATEHFNVPLEIACMFNYPTIAQLSTHIRELILSPQKVS